jgi:hypothetical protein
LAVALVAVPLPALSAGFPLGQLLVSDESNVYLVDPVTGSSATIITGLSGLKDIVYNPVSGSAFAVVGSNIVQITANSSGYSVGTFLSGVGGVQCLAVDALGRIYFNSEDFVEHHIGRVALDGTVSSITPASFFVPTHMIFSPDYSKLYVFEVPDNDVKVVSFPSDSISTLAGGLQFPPGGDVDAAGNVFVLEEGFPTGQISLVTPSGTKTTYSQQPWMDFCCEDDLALDRATGIKYVTSFGAGLYALYPDQTNRKLLDFGGSFFQGVSIIGSGPQCITTQPANQVVTVGSTATFSVEAGACGPATYQWLFNGTNIPGATGALLTINNVGLQNVGKYQVRISGAGAVQLSAEATLSLIDLQIDPVVTLTGPIGDHYRIEYRNGMEPTNSWHVLFNDVAATATMFDVVDHTAPRPPERFYRAFVIP